MPVVDTGFASGLARVLPTWLRRQAWLSRSAATLLGVEVLDTESIVRDPTVGWVDVRAMFAGDVSDLLRLVVAVRAELPPGIDPDAVIGEIELDGRPLVLFEAMAWRAGALSVARALMPEVIPFFIHILRCRRSTRCRYRWLLYH